jgi:hypothetical protein
MTALESLELCEIDSDSADQLGVLASLNQLTHFGMQMDGGGFALGESAWLRRVPRLTECCVFFVLAGLEGQLRLLPIL